MAWIKLIAFTIVIIYMVVNESERIETREVLDKFVITHTKAIDKIVKTQDYILKFLTIHEREHEHEHELKHKHTYHDGLPEWIKDNQIPTQ